MVILAPRHRLPYTPIVNRDDFILKRCAGQRVLHLACVACPATAELYESGQLLHRKLLPVCQRLAGMDIDPAGIAELQRRGVSDLYVADLLDAQQVSRMFDQLGFVPDWILAGELLEHLDAPGIMLRNLGPHLRPETKLLITVPNAFSVLRFLHLLLGREKVRTDHVAYYSYMNLKELVGRCHLEIVEVRWYRDSFPRKPVEKAVELALGPLMYFRPQFAPGIILVCKSRRSESAA